MKRQLINKLNDKTSSLNPLLCLDLSNKIHPILYSVKNVSSHNGFPLNYLQPVSVSHLYLYTRNDKDHAYNKGYLYYEHS